MNCRHIAVFSGGSAANSLVDVFGKVAVDESCSLSYIIPISDNGGSSSELIRVFGGPGIGDVRSRLVRLIPETPSSPEKAAIKSFFNHRLSPIPDAARIEWLSIIEATHPLWIHIPSSTRELIRSFLLTLNLEIVKRHRPSSIFSFQSASVGNLFLTGARLFTGSFDSSIYLLAAITGLPDTTNVIPAINSNFSHHISAGLADGTIITGQNSISHPSAPSATSSNTVPPATNIEVLQEIGIESPSTNTRRFSLELSQHDGVEDANLPGSLPTLRKQYIEFAKEDPEDLASRIERIWYINPYGQEIRPAPNPAVLESLSKASCVMYSIGSLYTSIIPCLVLRDVGAAIANPGIKVKIFILNGSLDRETRSLNTGAFSAADFVRAISDACDSSRGRKGEWREYVTHVIYLAGEGTPRVDKEELAEKGIECVRIYGRKNTSGGGMIYDTGALTGALEAILGSPKRGGERRGEKSRRNTVDENGGIIRKAVDRG
ncbi:hypothetical protein BJ878DRAFT_189524 [Calycina marina]|uniref:Uncharacterized protein n=1 Tax=Calycina marina TaxID=1763456 RepID=A0A9P7YYC8_9HELO|nr:hypothetical protein BJ878DRAFT_189524 [Calycina marina]